MYINSCRYYSVSIFCKIGVPPYVATIVFGVVGIIGTVISVSVIDKVREDACPAPPPPPPTPVPS